MRDGLDGGGRFIPDNIVDVHALSLLVSSRVAHDRATDNYTQHNTHGARYSVHVHRASKTGKDSWVQYIT